MKRNAAFVFVTAMLITAMAVKMQGQQNGAVTARSRRRE